MSKNAFPGMMPRFTRRSLLHGAAGFGLATLLDPSAFALDSKDTGPVSLDLGGDMWTLRQESGSGPIPAVIPGS
ncbi:MAG TPA: hypothetical protein VHZ25_15975, partial [Acidobacteriaceae bacterium]|nr:hypothetical protein [Acidobacteriaceae bacterium]